MSLKSFLVKQAVSKAVEVVKGKNPVLANDLPVEKNNSRKVTKIAKTVTKTSKKIVSVAKNVGKIADDVSSTAEVISFQKEIKNLRKEGKITQDILDAILCENKNKLALAQREAMRSEAMGQPLKYLSEEEVDAALGFRKQITKAVTHKVVGKN